MEEQNTIHKEITPLVKTAIAVSWVLYITSFFLPCIIVKYYPGTETVIGYQLFFTGWLGIIISNIGWYANPFFWFANFVYLIRSSYLAFVPAVIAFILSLYSLSTDEVWLDENAALDVEGFGIGYYFWLASMTVFLLTMIFELKTRFYKKK